MEAKIRPKSSKPNIKQLYLEINGLARQQVLVDFYNRFLGLSDFLTIRHVMKN
jgi:hypothetical protein